MAADRQEAGGEHYWYALRAFGPFGQSRLVSYGRCATRDLLEELRKEHNVPVANAMIDLGFKASEVYRFCLATGWQAFKGDDTEYFLHKDPATNRSVRRIWQRTFVDPFFGTRQARRLKPLALFRWSNNATKALLAEYMTGLVGDWTIPVLIGRDYLKQVTAERLLPRSGARSSCGRRSRRCDPAGWEPSQDREGGMPRPRFQAPRASRVAPACALSPGRFGPAT
jgi:hypothetical protein